MFPHYLPTIRTQRHTFLWAKNRTKAEVDECNRMLINHFRALLGMGAKTKIQNSHGLYISALWSDEAKFTNKWDNDFYRDRKTVVQDKKSIGDYLSRGHYGFGFNPPEEKQKEYYPAGTTPKIYQMLSEGVSAVREWNSWATKLSYVLYNMFDHEGYWGGHLGPIWKAEYLGISYYKEPLKAGEDANRNIWLQVRLQYHGGYGTELPYTDPDEPQTVRAGSPGSKY